jgi:hypothetical protein
LATIVLVGWLLTICAPPAFAQALATTAPPGTRTDGGPLGDWIETTFTLTAGYRTDTLNWHIAGNLQGTAPNVLSELTWSGLDILQLKLANRTVVRDRIHIRGHLDYGSVVSGSNRDSDYAGDNRTQEFSRSLNAVDGHNVWDGSAGIGPGFGFFESRLTVCPMIGYAVSEQDLNIVDGNQVFTAPPATTPIGPFENLDSRYQARWVGPWVGLDLFFSAPYTHGPFASVDIRLTGEYHRVDYDAEANWNLRTDFNHPVSFIHQADGEGWAAGAAIHLALKNRWGIHVGMNLKEMTAGSGLDRTFYADGTVVETRLQDVRWRSVALEAGLSCRF